MARLLSTAVGLIVVMAVARAGDIGFVEDYALAKDKGAALKQLIPGTEDYYYYHGLFYLTTEQYEKAEALWKSWHERFDQSARLTEIQTRHALLTYPKNPQKSLEYLRNRLGVRYDHQRVVPGAAVNLPTSFDPALIGRNRLKDYSLGRWGNLDNFEDAALDWLAGENLNVNQRRALVQRLQRPDVGNLVKLVADDLAAPNSPGFGAYAIHRLMTLTQLDELVKQRPALKDQSNFVHARIAKLHPGADADWRRDPAQTRAYLTTLLEYVRTLAPVHNSLKAHVLYQMLTLNRSEGTYDKSLFLEYLALPRRQPYMATKLLESEAQQRYPADLNANFTAVTLLPIIGGDEPLVRAYLKHFFKDADSPKEFEPFVNDQYLKYLFAVTKIELGLGDPDRWAAELPPEAFRAFKERVDIDFAPTNKTRFGVEEAVTLAVDVKNVPTLIVKVFEINTPAYYRQSLREVDTDVTLDGLVANSEQTFAYEDSPLRRIPRSFAFPQLNKPGVYVIDFIGGGKSSRALVRKGRLRPLVVTGVAGQQVSAVDEKNQPVKDFGVWLGGKEYHSGGDGVAVLPFSSAPGRHAIVLVAGEFASLDYLNHQPENYSLVAGIHVDREALLSQRLAAVLVRPQLYLNGTPVSKALLEEVKLRLVATDLDGIATTSEVPEFKVFEDRESSYEFRVPPRLANLAVTLTAKVKSLSAGSKHDLVAAEVFTLNAIGKTDKIEDLHFAKFGNEYAIEVLGRTGEAKADRPVHVAVKHRDFREPIQTNLKTDAAGRIKLGPLTDVVSVTATGPEGTAHTWNLPTDLFTYRSVMHAKSGDVVSVPYPGTEPARADLALFEMVGNTIKADKYEALSVAKGYLELKGLAAGDYDLWLKRSGERIRVRVVNGPAVAGHVLGAIRHLQLPGLAPAAIGGVTTDGDAIKVQVSNPSKFARVHVYATRYRPAYSPFGDLAKVQDQGLGGVYPGQADSVYLTGRNIGDEYRYVLDRKLATKYPGNMLDRPQLLLNPWAVRETNAGEQQAQAGGEFGRAGGATPPRSEPAPAKSDPGKPGAPADTAFANLDFLADASGVALNVVPDKDGVVTVPKALVGPHAWVHVVLVDPLHTQVKHVSLTESQAAVLDLRLRDGLDPKSHFTQQKTVSVITANQAFVIPDAAAARFEAYDSLAKVYTLYRTLNNDTKLAEFAFLTGWPKLKEEEKRTYYSKYASHELHVFLYKKDPEFFKAVVKPYLTNKKDKSFVDRWLLEEDLGDYLQPWKFGRLNVVERILLAQRINNEQPKTARHLAELLKLLPPNPDRDRLLFETGVVGSEMEKLAARAPATPPPVLAGLNEAEKGITLGSGMPVPAGPGGAPMGGTGGGFGGGGFGARGGRGGAAPANRPAAAGAIPAERKQAGDERLGKEVEEKKDEMRYRDGSPDADKKLKDLMDRGVAAPQDAANFFDDARRRSGDIPTQLYRPVEATKEWAENNYYNLPIGVQLDSLVPVSGFWADYARHVGNGPFLSKNLADASRNFTEIMLALAVLDLPFEPAKADVKFDGGRMTYTPAGPAVAFHEEVKPTAAPAGNLPILVSQNVYKANDRYREENGERLDKFVTGEFVVQTVYGCQIVVTNPSPSRQKLSVLVQIPVGAIPVGGAKATKAYPLDLEPYRTQTIDVLFYFPRPGTFAQFPVHVAKNEVPVAAAAPVTYTVVEKPTREDTESWDYVSQNGSLEQVVAFLNRENVHGLNLDRIAWRMKEKPAFEAVIPLLQSRHAYSPTLWSYSLLHDAVPQIRQFLLHAKQLSAECGGPIDSEVYTLNPVEQYLYEHLEYKPLVNARAHALGQRRQIVNDRLHAQYHAMLKTLSYRRALSDDDKFAVTYYLLLQDRIEDALGYFAQVDVAKVATKVQYDYCNAYLALYQEDLAKARTTAEKYAAYPVDRWRNAFTSVINQVDEAGGKPTKVSEADDRNQKQGLAASKEPNVEFTLDNKAIQLTWRNVETVTIHYYLMDVELLFSRNPFVQATGGQFATIKPNRTQVVKLPAGQSKQSIPLPEDLAKRNVLVEVTANGKSRALPYYATAMDVSLVENFGQVKVTDPAGKPLSKVYVKSYVRAADGSVKFHRDGYTDVRGRFDYATVSTPEKSPPVRYAVLVLSDDRGAAIKEAAPPQR